jgi:hypothetical protein
MPKKMIEVKKCFECPNCCWYDDQKSFACSLNNRNVIYGIETIQSWCPLPNAHQLKFLKTQE